MSTLRCLYERLRGFLRELSDEAAYQRHLERSGIAHSPSEWKRFADGRYRRKYQNAKCC